MKVIFCFMACSLSSIASFSQACNISVLNREGKAVAIKLQNVNDKSVYITNESNGVLNIADLGKNKDEYFKMTFLRMNSYLVYEAKLFLSQASNSEYFHYDRIQLPSLCAKPRNIYWVHVKEGHLGNPISSTK